MSGVRNDMSGKESVDLSLDLYIYASFFTVVLIWSFLGIFVTQSILLQVTADLMDWVVLITVIVVTYSIPISGISWYAKQRLVSVIPNWKFVERDVGIEEYRKMVKEYNAAYPLLMSKTHINRVIFVVILGSLSIILPILLRQISIDTALLSPAIFGFSLIILGVGLIATILPALPGNLSKEFPSQSFKEYRVGVSYLAQLPAIYWIGIRLEVGEWGGYYTLRNPTLSTRIDGIESVASMICEVDSRGTVIEVSIINESEHQGFPFNEVTPHPSPEELKDLIRQVLLWYIDVTGEKEILQDVLDDLKN